MAFIANINDPYYEGKLLVATRLLDGTFFEKSVIYICAHNETGAMGLVVNRIVDGIDCSDLAKQLNVEAFETPCQSPVYFGGPVETTRGFILHTKDYHNYGTQDVRSNFSITSTIETLKDISAGFGPKKHIIALGYSGWEEGQLEREVKENNWILAPADESLVFSNTPDKWGTAARSAGINFDHMYYQAGNA